MNQTLSNNSLTSPLDIHNSTGNEEAKKAFCVLCGFDFGVIIEGLDNQLAGLVMVSLLFCVLCSPCILMSFLYCCSGKNPREDKYEKVPASSSVSDA